MANLGDIPKYIRYDFLIAVLGMILISTAWYFSNIIKIDSASFIILYVCGIPLIIWGFGEMYANYEEEKSIISYRNLLKKKELIEEMEIKKIIDKNQKVLLINSLKEDMDEIIKRVSKNPNPSEQK